MVIRNRLAVLACLLLFVSAAIHLSLGIVSFAEAATTEAAVLPGLYLLAAIAAFTLLAGYVTGRIPVTTYVLGAGLATLLLLAYADVHAFGYAESTLGLETHGGGHGGEAVHDHGSAGGGHDHDHDGVGHVHEGGELVSEGGHDEESTLAVLSEHLRGDAYALVSKTVEAAAAVLFATLAVLER